MKFIVGLIAAVVILGGYAFFTAERGKKASPEKGPDFFMSERIELKTEDGIKIAGDYYAPEGERQISFGESRGVLLLHMMPADRKSWILFAEKLQQAGFPVLAIDLRGHGESEGGPDGYRKFSDTDHQASKLDVLEGARFLRSKGADAFHLVGASIGANLAFQYAAEHPNARSVVLLSPGLDYRGIKTEDAPGQLRANQAIYLVSSDDDVYSRDTVNQLLQKFSPDERHRVKIFSGAGHGTTILEKEPEFMDELAEWFTTL